MESPQAVCTGVGPLSVPGRWRLLSAACCKVKGLTVSSFPAVSGSLRGRLASQRGCWEAASLRKLGKPGFPNFRNLAMCRGLWGTGGGADGCYGLTLGGEPRTASPLPFARRPKGLRARARSWGAESRLPTRSVRSLRTTGTRSPPHPARAMRVSPAGSVGQVGAANLAA